MRIRSDAAAHSRWHRDNISTSLDTHRTSSRNNHSANIANIKWRCLNVIDVSSANIWCFTASFMLLSTGCVYLEQQQQQQPERADWSNEAPSNASLVCRLTSFQRVVSWPTPAVTSCSTQSLTHLVSAHIFNKIFSVHTCLGHLSALKAKEPKSGPKAEIGAGFLGEVSHQAVPAHHGECCKLPSES